MLSGLHKDHKPGRSKRPVVNGNVGPMTNLSNITSDLLEPFLEELREKVEKNNTCKSTEELLHKFTEYNKSVETKNEVTDKKFIASMDVKALFPSLRSDQCIEAVKRMILSSELKIEGIEYKELLILLRKNLSTKEIREKDLTHLIPDKIPKKKKNSNKNGDESKNENTNNDENEIEGKNPDAKDDMNEKCKNDYYDSWKFPKENFNKYEQKQMIVEAVSVAINLIMNNHIYVFDGKVFLQEDEGSIGMRLTGILAEIVMIFWCKKTC